MGIFGKIFNNPEDKINAEENGLSWIELKDVNTLNEIKEISKQKPVIIFKHSTRCGVSRGVVKQFEKQIKNYSNTEFYLLDLLSHRDISNAIAETFKVIHQSPQMLLIKNGEVVKHESHYEIMDVELERYLG